MLGPFPSVFETTLIEYDCQWNENPPQKYQQQHYNRPDGVSRNHHLPIGDKIDLGPILRPGIQTTEELKEYLRDATYATQREPEYQGGILDLVVISAVCGDFDLDGDVDAADRTALTANWTGALAERGNMTIAQGDCDADGDVDSADQGGMLANWTGAIGLAGTPQFDVESASEGVLNTVPEPASQTLLLIAALMSIATIRPRKWSRTPEHCLAEFR